MSCSTKFVVYYSYTIRLLTGLKYCMQNAPNRDSTVIIRKKSRNTLHNRCCLMLGFVYTISYITEPFRTEFPVRLLICTSQYTKPCTVQDMINYLIIYQMYTKLTQTDWDFDYMIDYPTNILTNDNDYAIAKWYKHISYNCTLLTV